jgi:N-acetylmuramic acid 6-phosphate etherase
MDRILAIEGGATHTTAALYTAEGKLIRERETGPANPAACGLRHTGRVLADACAALLTEADGRLHIAAGISGASDPDHRNRLAAYLLENTPAASVRLTTDLHALLHACPDADCQLVIAGTGAAVLSRNRNGEIIQTGGWGCLFGEKGGAWGVAMAALHAAAAAIDGTGPETALAHALPEAAGFASLHDMKTRMNPADRKAIAALAVTVSRIAEKDDVAAGCLEEQARQLAATARSGRRRTGLPEDAPIYFYGGLADHAPVYRKAFLTACAAFCDAPVAVPPQTGTRAVLALMKCDRSSEWLSCREKAGGDETAAARPTEARDTLYPPIDRLQPLDIVDRMRLEDQAAVDAVSAQAAQIAALIECAAGTLRKGGRLLYAGAGTSGRLGVLDASECPPTFGVDPGRIAGIIAGGDIALRHAAEGAEDDREGAAQDMARYNAGPGDLVAGITASGTTPYVHAALECAARAGARTALITCNPRAQTGADYCIALDTGPEALAGSTRLKAGTATKMVLNMITTGAMALSGYVCEGMMVCMPPTNAKLRDRAVRMVAALAAAPEDTARQALENCDWHIRKATVMLLAGTDARNAAVLLEKYGGDLRRALRNRDTR